MTTFDTETTTGILFVCLGNICRSPMAEGLFRHMALEAGLLDRLVIDSCGTSDYHAGYAPDHRATRAMKRLGIDITGLRARQVEQSDFDRFDYIFAMDRSNLETLHSRAPKSSHEKIRLFLDLIPGQTEREVPDPYYGGEEGFQHVLELLTAAATELLAEIQRASSRLVTAEKFTLRGS